MLTPVHTPQLAGSTRVRGPARGQSAMLTPVLRGGNDQRRGAGARSGEIDRRRRTSSQGGRQAHISKLQRTVRVESSITHFGRYHILGLLGHGGMGQVLLAYDPRLERKVALKLLRSTHSEADASPDELRDALKDRLRLQREARALAHLDHPNVVEIFDVGVHDEQVFLAMDYVEGRTLRAWAQQDERSWRDVVEVMLQVGHGLATAHAKGVVHRDFKPDNVMVSADGRAYIIDFGIALDEGQYDDEEARLPDTIPEGRISRSCADTASHSRLTSTNSMLGTPAYMAPEQRFSSTCDGLADQYSFCVTFFELLYGERPSMVESEQLPRDSLEVGMTQVPRRGRDVPAWLYNAVLRGLASEPSERHLSMMALCSMIEDRYGAPQRRRIWETAGLGLVAALWLVWSVASSVASDHARSLCPDASAQWQDIWSPERSQMLRAAFLATGASNAGETWDRVDEIVGEHRRAWIDLHAEVCESTLIRHERLDSDMDMSMRCLHIDLERYRVLSQQFLDADIPVVQRAVQASMSMPEVEICADTQRLRKGGIAVSNPQLDARVDELRREIAGIEVLHQSGRWRAAKRAAQALRPRVDALGSRSIEADWANWMGRARARLGESEAAAQYFELAIASALAVDDLHRAAMAGTSLVFERAYRQARHEDAGDLLETIQAWSHALGNPPGLESDLWTQRGIIAAIQGRVRDSTLAFQTALDLALSIHGEMHSRVSYLYGNLAISAAQRGDMHRAGVLHRRALRSMEGVLGVNHPELALQLSNLSMNLRGEGSHAEAIGFDRRAVALCEAATGGDDHIACVRYRGILADGLAMMGEYTEAVAIQERNLRAQQALGQRGRFDMPWSQVAMAKVYIARGDWARAVELAREGWAATMADTTVIPYVRKEAEWTLGSALLQAGQLEAAQQWLETALEGTETGGEDVFPAIGVAYCLRELGLVATRSGRTAQGLAQQHEALEIIAGIYGGQSSLRAGFLLAASESATGAGAHVEAVAWAREALAGESNNFGADHHALSLVWGRLARALAGAGQDREALASYRRALELFAGSEYHPDVVQAHAAEMRALAARSVGAGVRL